MGIQFLIRLYIKGSIHVALAVTSMVYVTEILTHNKFPYHFYLAVFFGSIVGYNFIKYGLEVKRYIIANKQLVLPLLVLSVVSGILAIYFGLGFSYQQYKIIGILLALLILYTIPLVPNLSNLRNYSGLKIYIVAAVWAGVTVVLPLSSSTLDNWLAFTLSRFIFTLVLMLPFEIRDLKYDAPNLKTLPQQLGVRNTKILGVVLLIAWLIFEVVLLVHPLFISLLMALTLGIALLLSKVENKRIFTVFWVEAIPIFYAALLTLLT